MHMFGNLVLPQASLVGVILLWKQTCQGAVDDHASNGLALTQIWVPLLSCHQGRFFFLTRDREMSGIGQRRLCKMSTRLRM